MGSRITPSEQSRNRLTALRTGLLRLHKSLLDSERASYDHDIQRIHTSGQFLELLLHDPWFAWLRELSELVVVIDETLDAEEPATVEGADNLIAKARSLVAPAENGTGFGKRYFEALQRDPNVVMAHAEMVRLLASIE